MNPCQVTLALFVALALSGGALAASDDDAAALTGQIQTMDVSATTKGSSQVIGKIAADYEAFAGSTENSTALVTGLRNGSEITLTQDGEPSATFTPATKPMGYGNVSTSLALAKYQLAQQGITNPTPEQLQTALNGGTITVDGKTVEYQGVLQMRADGIGWGQIAQQLGTKLGFVVSGIKAQNAQIANLPNAKPATAPMTSRVTTASGGESNAAGGDKGSSAGRGIVNAGGGAGSSAASGKGVNSITSAGGAGASPRGQGIVTAGGHGGMPVANGLSDSAGVGIVTGSGSAVGASAAAGANHGRALGRAN
jgi:antitoxin (DNA-binding transcriptional repressor) of toxin-antitoxin stability system